MKIKVSLEKNYQLLHDLLPTEGKLLDIGCGYGFMSYMLYFTSNKREITGIDYGKLTPVLIEAVKELQKQIASLEQEKKTISLQMEQGKLDNFKLLLINRLQSSRKSGKSI